MSTTYSNRREGPGKHRGPNRKKSSHKEQQSTDTSEVASGTESAASSALSLIADSVIFDSEFGTWDGTGWNVNLKVHAAYVHYEVP